VSLISLKDIILASKSKARGEILRGVDIAFDTLPAKIDEEAVKSALIKQRDPLNPADLAELLAQTKALNLSENNNSAYVIGADQTMSCEGILFNKAKDLDEAKENFYFLRGKTHTLHSAVCVALNGEVIWSHVDEAHLTMINFSNDFLGTYLAKMGDDVLTTVGGYQLENLGALLFEKIEGDYHTILGLPLLPLIAFLRSEKGVIA